MRNPSSGEAKQMRRLATSPQNSDPSAHDVVKDVCVDRSYHGVPMVFWESGIETAWG